MADVVIKKPDLNSDNVNKNIADIDTWIHDTADKINYFMSHVGSENLSDDIIDIAMIERIITQLSQKQGLIRFDRKPKENSNAAISSGGVYDVYMSLKEAIDASPFVVRNGKVCVRYRKKVG